MHQRTWCYCYFVFCNDVPHTELYTLSLHDALPIWLADRDHADLRVLGLQLAPQLDGAIARAVLDRKSTRLNSSHRCISYAVFCLKKKKKTVHTFSLANDETNHKYISGNYPVHETRR